jgi:pimeloyl-ACP methyl ester carboxylesterase
VVASLPFARAGAGDGTFDSQGVRIRYVTAGSGEAVVLIHGWMGDSSMWGRDIFGATRLNTKNAEGFQLIALDCRGHGKSDKPHDENKYDAEVAGDVVRLLDHLKVDKAHLVGYSSGAFVVGKVAAMRPDCVRSLVFAGQGPVLGEPKASDFSQVEAFAKLVDEGKDLGEYVRAITPADRPKPTEEQARAIAKLMYGNKDVKALAAAGRGFKRLAVTPEELKKCDAPILFIHGENESDHVKNKIASARTALGRGEVRIIAGGDHMTTLGKPEFSAALIGFLRAARAK